MENQCGKQLNETFSKLRELVEEKSKNVLGEYTLSRLAVSHVIDQTLADFLLEILNDEKIKRKLVNKASKALINTKKEREQAERARYKKNLKLWSITKGQIPCINGCGYLRQQTKEQVHEGFNTFLCKDCTDKLEKENIRIWDIKKTVYQVLGIE